MSQIVVPAAAKSVITPVAQTTFQVGTYTPLTDAFTKVVDLNDHQSFWLVKVGLPQPPKLYARTSTIRVAGERITNWNYKNRHVTLTIHLLYQNGTTALLAAVRSLLAAIENPPYRIAFAPPNASVLTYADVVAVSHTIPSDAKIILAKALSNITIDFECAPGFSGDRITLSNLVSNPGFEAPSGPGVIVFNDGFTNANAYTTVSGSAPSVASSTLTVPANSVVSFGSASWGALNQWQCRFQYLGNSCYFALHYQDANNQLRFDVNPTNLYLDHFVAGAAHIVASVSYTPTVNAYYWMQVTQFPAAPGTQCNVVAQLLTDSAGNPGGVVATLGPVATYDGVTALSGKCAFMTTGSALPVGGGTNSGKQQVSLFGPGAWTTGSFGSGDAAFAWDQSTSATYGGGAVTSYGAARVDAAPASTLNAQWFSARSLSASDIMQTAIPVANGASAQTLNVSAWVKSAGVGAGCTQELLVNEYDGFGNYRFQNAVAGGAASVTGAQSAWKQLSGTYTTTAGTYWIVLILAAVDGTSGSASGMVWWENVQCWNQTTTGQTVMPYCELRFPQSPAQLLLTGLQGDMPAPAFVAWGTFLSAWNTSQSLSYALGRRAQASANAQLAGVSHGFYGTALSPTATAALDATSYGGYYITAAIGNGWNPRAFSFAPSDALGVYHLFARLWTNQAVGNLPNVQSRVITQQKTAAWYGATTNSDLLGTYYGPYVSPISASSTWTPSDAGQANVPALPTGALTDLTQTYLTPRPQFGDTTGGGSTGRANWQCLLPVDGAVIVGNLNNPSNAPFAVSNQWLWTYLDGLLLNKGGIINGEVTDEGATYSLETTPLPNPAHGGGGPGTSGTGAINVNNLADPYLTLDPNVTAAAVSGATTAAGGVGVNQLAGYVADNTGAVLPLHAEFQYTPLYLYPRQQ